MNGSCTIGSILAILFSMICIYTLIMFVTNDVVKEKYTNYQSYNEHIDTKHFFLLQPIESEITMSMLNHECIDIGYTSEENVDIFKKILELNNVKPKCLTYQFLNEFTADTWNKVSMVMFVGTSVERSNIISNAKIVAYFPENPKGIQRLFPRNDFSVYNDTMTTTFLLNMSFKNPSFYIYQTEQIVQFDPKYHFVLSGKIDGEYKQTSFDEDTITMNTSTIDGLNTDIGYVVLVKNQEYIPMNGKYVVTENEPVIKMVKRINVKKEQPICVNSDETHYKEYQTKYSCEHPNTIVGIPKLERLKWKSVCQRDYECEYDSESMVGCEMKTCIHSPITHYKNNAHI